MCGQRRQPLSAIPTLWARPRAVIELGGGRLPRHIPLGGGRAAYEGAQQRPGLELGSFSPHSHHLTASVPSLWLSFHPADATSDEQERSDGRQGHGPQS
jgi:hypothetical protein